MARTHSYEATVVWTGDRGSGTSAYDAYDRDHEIRIDGKPALLGSADPAYRGDPGRHNPEDLLLAALASCHMLWYLHLCAEAKIQVTGYEDRATGTMVTKKAGGRFTEAVLHPRVTVAAGADTAKALALHAEASRLCFIANSVNFPLRHEAEIVVAG